MPAELVLVRVQDGSFRPATSHDQELATKWKIGQPVRVQAIQLKPRSLQQHKRYWGGLLSLAFDYWEPTGGLIGATETKTLKQFSDWLDRKSTGSGAVRRACRAFLVELRESRSQKIETPEKSKQALHEWVKEQAGYYDLVQTPSGIRRRAKSINFNAMPQDEFEQFYKDAFSVVWRFILSRSFSNEVEAENAIHQLLALG